MSDSKQKILIVDDATENIELLAGLLKAEYTTFFAKKGEKALQLAKNKKPDLILLDIVMPGMDGYEVCRRLKADPETSDIPVIFVTAMQGADDEMQGLEVGAIDFITKPFRPVLVKARVKNHLQLQQAHAAVAQARDKTALLLNNSGQGFLSIGSDLRVDKEFSSECRHIFEQDDLSGRPVASLFFPESVEAQNNYEKNLQRVFQAPDEHIRELYISLLQTNLQLGKRFFDVEIKFVSHVSLMFILTDVTLERKLKDEVYQERNRLAFIVSAVSDSKNFMDSLEGYRHFYEQRLPSILETLTSPEETHCEVYRQVHTYKGLFSLFELIYTPKALHNMETELANLNPAKDDNISGAIQEIFARHKVLEALQNDLDILEDALGQSFFKEKGIIPLSKEDVGKIETLARILLDNPENVRGDDVRAQLEFLRRIRYVDFKELIISLPRAAVQLAKRKEKSVKPFVVEGDMVNVDPDVYGPFAMSLLHIIRNAVVHGLEYPEERTMLDKPEDGEISCRVENLGAAFRVTISDDGQGVDTETLRERALEQGLLSAGDAQNLSREMVLNLIFHHGFSTTEEVDEASGRGVGLNAMMAELEKLGGKVDFESTPGEGASFIFTVPLQ